MMIYKVTAYDDKIFVEAESADDAADKVIAFFGGMPKSLLNCEQIESLPDGEELL